MKLRTELTIAPAQHKLNIKSPVLTIGSCFAEVIGNRLHANKCQVMSNPFGVIFNPVSIQKIIGQCLNNHTVDLDLLTNNKDIWQHYDYHSLFWAKSEQGLLQKLDDTLKNVEAFLDLRPTVVITLGTAFVYRHIKTNQIVANCHKTPASQFEKILLSYSQIMEAIHCVVEYLQPFSSDIVLTVSPIRHTRDGLELNQVSKSLLRVACYEMTQKYDRVGYFPSYELMMDDLRDYRFYKSDLVHPNEIAEDYIFKKFIETYYDNESLLFFEQWQKIKTALRHRPMYPLTIEHQRFLKTTLESLRLFSNVIDVSSEIDDIRNELEKF